MDEKKNSKYRAIGFEVFKVFTAVAVVVFVLLNFSIFLDFIKKVVNTLNPIWVGVVLAFLVSPLYNKMTGRLSKKLSLNLSKIIATAASIIIVTGIIYGLIALIIPKVIESVVSLYDQAPQYFENAKDFFENLPSDFWLNGFLLRFYDSLTGYLDDITTSVILPNIDIIATSVFSSVKNVVSWVYYVLVGIVVMAYLLNIKDVMLPKFKKLIYAMFKPGSADSICTEIRRACDVFGGFISGKLLDSLIIGIICFIVLEILKMPYALLITVIVGVTNIIPYLGPFIGAIPSAFIIFMVDPVQSLVFIVFIFILQQIDGNIIGPKILGNTTGISSFWILFSVVLFGGILGFIGMIIAVPTWALLMNLIKRISEKKLRQKGLPEDSASYPIGKEVDYERKD